MLLSPKALRALEDMATDALEGTVWHFTDPKNLELARDHRSPVAWTSDIAIHSARLHVRGEPNVLYASPAEVGPVLELIRYTDLDPMVLPRRLRVQLAVKANVLDLTDRATLLDLGLDRDDLRRDADYGLPQALAAKARQRADVDGVLIPSAAHPAGVTIGIFHRAIARTVSVQGDPDVVEVRIAIELVPDV